MSSAVETYERTSVLPVSADEAFAWHERPGALDRLIPPWEQVEVKQRGDGVRDGSRVEMVQRVGPLRLRWVAQHHGYQPGLEFSDTQVAGPFASWEHIHRFEPRPDNRCLLRDHIEYKIPAGALGRILGRRAVHRRIDRMFDYRHETTAVDLATHARYASSSRRLRVAVTGSRGLVGSSLVPLLTTGDHQVVRVVRGERDEESQESIAWDPAKGFRDPSALEGVDAVVHLAGEGIAASRWNDAVKKQIRDSRVEGTRVLCEALAKLSQRPRVLVSASAIGYYGDRGDEVLQEDSPPGSGFLAGVARDWEAAAQPAVNAGIRVVCLRFGVILSPRGGALAQMLTPFRLGGGGRIGSGRQWWSWISIDDAVGAIHHAIMNEVLAGPVNGVAPHPVTNAEFTQILGRVLNRPTLVPMPAFAARMALGEMADELLLASARVTPAKLLETGYAFRQPTLEAALRHLLGK